MRRTLKKHTVTHMTSAKVVDGTLILSLPNAVTPAVWRLDLGHTKASAMEVRKHEDGQFVLVLKTPKGDLHDIAPFDSHDEAMAALMVVGQAMECAHGQIKPNFYATNENKKTGKQTNRKGEKAALPAIYRKKEKFSVGKLISGVVAVILLILAVNALMNLGPRPASSVYNQARTRNPVVSSTNAPVQEGKTGVAISADKFLRTR